jgi:hypothetical protein
LAERAIFGPMADVRDIDQPGGWLVRVITPGAPAISRYFYAYELDQARAEQMVRTAANVTHGETCEALKQLNIHALTGEGMNPGDVKQYG